LDIVLSDWMFRLLDKRSKTYTHVLRKDVLVIKIPKEELMADAFYVNRALRGLSKTEKEKLEPFDIIFKNKIGETYVNRKNNPS